MRKTVLAATAFAVASGAMTIQVLAADLDFMPPPPPFVPTWQGFYVGGHVGFGETKFDFRQDVDFFDAQGVEIGNNTFRSSVSPNGLVGGVQGGYNFQINALVLGIEGDISFTDWSESTGVFDSLVDDVEGPDVDVFGAASGDVDFITSVRGRVGWALGNALIYGTGGVAWAEAEARARIVEDDITVASGKKDLDDLGFVIGGGLGWMVIPQTFSVGVEGLYYFFKDKAVLFDNTDDPILLENGDEVEIRATAELHDTWVIRARADFHF